MCSILAIALAVYLTNKLDGRDGNVGAYGPARSGGYAKPVGLKSAVC